MAGVKNLGHANIRVRDLERSEKFYTEVLGLHVTLRRGNLVFLSAREHSHELAIGAMGDGVLEPDETRIGTNHFAWEVETFDELQGMVNHLKSKGVEILRSRSNNFSTGFYFNDPDGNGLEIYHEDLEDFRNKSWDGKYPRQLEGIPH